MLEVTDVVSGEGITGERVGGDDVKEVVIGGDSERVLLISDAIEVIVVEDGEGLEVEISGWIVITSVVTDPGWQFVTAAGHDVMVYVVVVRTADVRVVVRDEVMELLGDVLEELARVVVGDEVVVELLEDVEDTVTDSEHPEALVLSVRTIVYPVALRSI